jgi:YggT family protein
VLPLRRLIPSLGSLDTATLLLAYVIMLAKLVTLQLLQSGQVLLVPSLFFSLIFLVKEILTLLFWILVIRALLSWFSQGRSPVEYVMHQLTEPLLRPVRRILPPLGGLDLSVLVVLIGLQFVNILFSSWFPGL